MSVLKGWAGHLFLFLLVCAGLYFLISFLYVCFIVLDPPTTMLGIIIGVVVGVALVSMLCFILLFFLCLQRRIKRTKCKVKGHMEVGVV